MSHVDELIADVKAAQAETKTHEGVEGFDWQGLMMQVLLMLLEAWKRKQ